MRAEVGGPYLRPVSSTLHFALANIWGFPRGEAFGEVVAKRIKKDKTKEKAASEVAE